MSCEDDIDEEAERLENTTEWRNSRWLDDVFSYHPPTGNDLEKYQKIRKAGKHFALVLLNTCVPSADRTAAIRKIREAVMTANAAIALKGSV